MSFIIAVAVLSFSPAADAVTFNQSGNIVQINTINDGAAWSFDVWWTDTTETPVPQTAAKKLGDWSVTSGQTAYSIQLPDTHRRYRFDVTSVKPSSTGTDTYTTVQTFAEPVWGQFGVRVMRGGTVIGFQAWDLLQGVQPYWSGGTEYQFPDLSVGVADGDVVQVIHGSSGNYSVWSSYTVNRPGNLSTSGMALRKVWDEETEENYGSVSGSFKVGYELAAVDDGGSGTFENPNWIGFQEPTPTPEPTGTVEPTPTVEASISANFDATTAALISAPIVQSVNEQRTLTAILGGLLSFAAYFSGTRRAVSF